jgi:hypothetical protein
MRLPPRGTPLLPGTFVLPDPVEEGGRLVFREPLRDTLVPLAAVAALDLAACVGVAVAASWIQVVFLAVAAGLSFLVAALLSSLFRRPEVVLDRAAGSVRLRRPEHGPMEIPLADLRAVTLEPVSGGGLEAPAAGLETRDGGWLPLHVGWAPARGGDAARVRVRGEAVARWLGLPLEERGGPPPSTGAGSAGPAAVVE